MTTADDGPSRDAASMPEDLLSVESITRLANEFFQTLGQPGPEAFTDAQQAPVAGPIGSGGTGVGGQPTDSSVLADAGIDASSPAVVSTGLNAPSNPGSPLPSSFTSAGVSGFDSDGFDLGSLGVSTSLVDSLPESPDEVQAQTTALDHEQSPVDVTRLAQVAIAEFPSAEFVAEKVADHPVSPDEFAQYALGDHPFLEGKYDQALTELDLSGFPAGEEFTGHDPALLEGLVSTSDAAVYAEPITDALGSPHIFDAVIVDELSPDGYSGTVPLVGSDEATNEAKDVGRSAARPIAGHGESAYEPDETVANSAVPLGRVAIDEPATDTSPATGESTTEPSEFGGEEFSPTLVPVVPAKKDMFDAERIREDFPILSEKVHGQRIAWLDNGATTQKPQSVIDRISYFYEHENSNVHRTAHTLAGRATDAYEGAREKIRRFVNASSSDEIVYVRGATEGMNLIANTYGEQNVGEGDEILISWLEHHANIVPWQMLCARKGAKLKVAPVDDTGQVILSEYERLITPRTKLISFTQVSNALGTITPAAEMIEIAHRHGVPVVLDGAQGVLHMRVDVQQLKPDFYVFSGHKMFGPTGIGVVYGRYELLQQMPPWQGGGNMIDCVQFDRTTYQDPPWRFEAGTGNIADAVGLGAAIDYIQSVGIENIASHEHHLLEYGTAGLLTVPGLRLIGTAENKAAVMSFVLDGHDPEDVGSYLDQHGIAVRAGHHCAQPILRRFGVNATVRPSLALYNTTEDLDRLVEALCRLQTGS